MRKSEIIDLFTREGYAVAFLNNPVRVTATNGDTFLSANNLTNLYKKRPRIPRVFKPKHESQTHYLKCEREYYQATAAGKKKFELRWNDRDYHVGDIVVLEETIQGRKTGAFLPERVIRYVLKEVEHLGLREGYCIINF